MLFFTIAQGYGKWRDISQTCSKQLTNHVTLVQLTITFCFSEGVGS